MKKVIYSKIDKQYIQALPRAVFDGRIIVINTAGEAEKAVGYLLSQDILGVDTETRPSFKKGRSYVVALLQVSTHDTCFLFRLNIMGLTQPVINLLEDKKYRKSDCHCMMTYYPCTNAPTSRRATSSTYRNMYANLESKT